MAKIQPRPGILDIKPYVGGNAGISGDAQIINLASNESALGPSPNAIKAYQSLTNTLHRYPDGNSHALRKNIAEQYQLDTNRIVCGNGSERLIDLIARAYAGPGDEILYSEYGFLMYPICCLAAGAQPVTAKESNFTANIDSLLAKVSDKTKIVFLANPNNPTGTYLNQTELKNLRDSLPDHVLLVIDSAYAEYVIADDYSAGHELVNDQTANVAVLHTFSKIYGLAALRLGWAYCPTPIADVLNRIRGSFNITSPAQCAGVAALEDQEHVQRSKAHNQKWLPWVTQQFEALSLRVTPSAGNFVLVHFDTVNQCQSAHQYLQSKNIIVRPMHAYQLPAALRITIGLETELQACLNALQEGLA